jgi:hypothetical protein
VGSFQIFKCFSEFNFVVSLIRVSLHNDENTLLAVQYSLSIRLSFLPEDVLVSISVTICPCDVIPDI